MNPTKQVHSMELACHEFITSGFLLGHTPYDIIITTQSCIYNFAYYWYYMYYFLGVFPVGGKKVQRRKKKGWPYTVECRG